MSCIMSSKITGFCTFILETLIISFIFSGSLYSYTDNFLDLNLSLNLDSESKSTSNPNLNTDSNINSDSKLNPTISTKKTPKIYLGGSRFYGIPESLSCSSMFMTFKKSFIKRHTIINIQKTSNPFLRISFPAVVLKDHFYDSPFAVRDMAPCYIKEYDFYKEKFKYNMKLKLALYIHGPVTLGNITLGGFYYLFENNEDTKKAFSEDIGYLITKEGILVSARYRGIEMIINHNVFGVPYCDLGVKFW